MRNRLFDFFLLFVSQIIGEIVRQVGSARVFQDCQQKILIFLHKFLNLWFTQQFVFENTAISFRTNTCGVEILAGEFLGLVRKIAFVTPMTIVCQKEFTQFLGQIDRGRGIQSSELAYISVIWSNFSIFLNWEKIFEGCGVYLRLLSFIFYRISALDFFVFLCFLHFL